MYTITGATGNTGRRIAEALLDGGRQVRVVGRNMERLKGLVARGAEPFVASLDDVAAITRALRGARAAYLMIPPSYGEPDFRAYQNRVGHALAEAVSAARVLHVVNLSSVGAHLAERVGPINGLHDQEQRLNRLADVHVLHLRPVSFMENVLFNINLIKQAGINGTPLRADLAIPMIAAQDIAAVAARRLLALDFSGKTTKELLGPREISMAEATHIIGKAIGKPDLPYVQFPYDEAEKAMIGTGMSPNVARAFVEMYRAFNEGLLRQTEPRSAANTTPTSFDAFVRTFAAAYAAKT
ncbi:MAG: NmrA family NAD(P)-binding protein [Nitrospirota bacterium]